ncbi:MAG: HAD family phosphatase [Pyrinomonadaceae bacterium]|nr:HAD family phosphatase [Pyrinomonadaceae bacterium]
MIKAILFDFNGVIVDDEGIQREIYRELLAAEGVEMTDEDYAASHGMDDVTFVRAAYERKGKTVDDAKRDEIIAAKFDKWREVVGDDLPLFPGIVDFVEKMSHEFALGVVSMEKRQQIEYILAKSGLAKHFDVIVSAEDVSACKPDPQSYRIGFDKIDASRTARGHLPMTHRECLVIEDTAPGIQAARNADLPALGVTNTVDAATLRTAGAGAIATDLRDWMPESIRRVF